MKNVGGLDVDGISQVSGARSAMIRHRGKFPKTIWQRGAIYSTKKSRADVSQGRSPEIRKKGKASLLNNNQMIGTFEHGIGTFSEANNRFTHGSFQNFNILNQHQF